MDDDTKNINDRRILDFLLQNHAEHCPPENFIEDTWVCDACPLARYLKREDGSNMGCIAAVKQLFGSSNDEAFYKLAMRITAELEIEKMLTTDE